jgi:hypothetical protein
MLLGERSFKLVGAGAYDEVVTHNPAAHMAIYHERDSTEHPFFLQRIGALTLGCRSSGVLTSWIQLGSHFVLEEACPSEKSGR